jgi:hypothetical protein
MPGATRRRATVAGLIDSGLDRSIYAAFRGKLLKGVLRRLVTPAGGALDGDGDPEAATTQLIKLEGFTEAYSRFSRAQAGIPDTDLKLNIFAGSMRGVRPAIGNQARLDRRGGASTWYQIKGPVDIDPAGVLWVCQSFEIEAPANVG